MTEPHPSCRRLLAPSHPTPRSPSHGHLPLHPVRRETRARKAAPTPADHAVDHLVPTPIKSLRYSPSSLPPPPCTRYHATVPHARWKAFLPFSLFFLLTTWAGQLAGMSHPTQPEPTRLATRHVTTARATPSADRYLPVCPTSSFVFSFSFLFISFYLSPFTGHYHKSKGNDHRV